ncbi:MAG TPA: cupin domain-containing protein [Thermomicrobiales bacterium]|nr:cupin domain-containing protein [Thermomicrobiales bacterium]
MIAFQLSNLELGEFWHDEAPRDRGRGAFPLVGVPGTDSTGMVYFEIAPGDSLGLHTDSPDELVVVLSGTALATVGDETGRLEAGSVAFIPSMAPHGFQSVGSEPLRVVGIFPNSDVVSTFEYALQPWGTRVVAFKGAA